MTLRRIDQIGAVMGRYSGREWSDDEVSDALSLCIPEAVAALGFRLAESRITVRLPVGGDRLVLPDGFLGPTRFVVDGKRYERVALSQIASGPNRYALAGRDLILSAPGGGVAVLDYRGIERSVSPGVGVSNEGMGEIYYDMVAGEHTDAAPDALGRYHLTLDAIPGSLDAVDVAFSAIGQLMEHHPGVFLYGALKHSAIGIQDHDNASRYEMAQGRAIQDARMVLLKSEWGAGKLQMRRV